MRLLFTTVLLLSPVWQTTAPAPAPARQPRQIEARQLSLVTSQSAVSVRPGGTLTLYVDVFPKTRMHVYAPEQTGGYIRITLDLHEGAAVARGKTLFPKASDYFFAPLNETFKVYDAPFRISQDVAIPATRAVRRRAAANRPLAIHGTLRYQACDDEVCYRPEAVNVRWSVALQPGAPR